MSEIDAFAPLDRILERIRAASAPYEFRTFLLGLHLPEDWTQDRRDDVGRPLRTSIGRALEGEVWPDREVSFTEPDVQFIIDPRTAEVRVVSAPVFVGGRYRKYARDISSAEWHHHACKGRGCPRCEFRGTLCRLSVERVVSAPIREAAGGEATFFHSMGREDVDVRMLGSGRPFVIEVRSPRRRSLDLAGIEGEIAARGAGEVDAIGLAMADRPAVARIKAADAEKTYEAVVDAAADLPADFGERVARLAGVVIDQRTPRRVLRRRADLVRKRRVVESAAEPIDGRRFRWRVRAAAGTYIKELASGDAGRTHPSLSEILDAPCVVEALDVLEIDWRAPWEGGTS
ncbi:MAG: tRNA pseudouridine(54/55) synthase Pus10 [Planctomycetes bacterium]|nr:tRNA pseudouridine(54/55) synthase Pus10 [Planctomycetota bacterium]